MSDLWRFDLQLFGDATETGGADVESSAEQEQAEEMVPKSELERAENEIRDLKQRIEQLTQTMMSPAYLQAIQAGYPAPYQAAQGQLPEAEAEHEAEEPDFEKIGPKEFAKWIKEQVKKDIQSEIQALNAKTDMLQVQKELEEARTQYRDFDLYRDVLIGIAREYPQIKPKDAYYVAKGRLGHWDRPSAPAAPVRKPPAKPPTQTEKPGIAPTAASRGTYTAQEAYEEAWKRAGLDKILGQ